MLDGDPAPPPKGAQPHSAHVYYGQTAGWVKMTLGMEVCLGSGYIVLVGDPAPPRKAQPPIFGPCCSQTAGWIKMPFWRQALAQTTLYTTNTIVVV